MFRYVSIDGISAFIDRYHDRIILKGSAELVFFIADRLKMASSRSDPDLFQVIATQKF